jgi:iron complex outermembrane recepter protein
MMNKATIQATLVGLCTMLSPGAYAIADAPKQVDIPAGELSVALLRFSKQYGADLVYRPEQVRGVKTHGAHGSLTTEQAAAQLLQGTTLELRTDPSGAMLIAPPGAGSTQGTNPPDASNTARGAGDDSKEAGKRTSQEFRVAQVAQGTAGSPAVGDDQISEKKRKEEGLSEIVVTGTHIRGVTSSASPVQIYTRDDIDRTGLGSIQAFIEKLPNNFASASENTVAAVAGGGTAASVGNSDGASAVNLRGLGNDSTLVLVNGRRIAPGGALGNITDLSLIPLSAVERVEIVSDGASAIYGSDAVGGVVNFILREDYEGAETRARYGSVSEGGSHETQIGQTVGKMWESGSALLSYQYFDRTPLSALDRAYSNTVQSPFALLPEQVSQSAYASLRQMLSNGIQLFGDGTFSHRSTYADASIPIDQRTLGVIDAASGTLGGRSPISDTSALEISTTYGTSKTRDQTNYGGIPSVFDDVRSSVLSVDAKLDGTIATTHAGTIAYAAGGQFRRESFDSEEAVAGSPGEQRFNPKRSISAGFAELRIPMVGPVSTSSGPNRLELNLAARYEHYSDFGSTTNPQLGVIWNPLVSLKVRGTVGTSFKAPLLSDLNPVPGGAFVIPLSDPRGGSASCAPFASTDTCTNVLEVGGGNPGLEPEKARTWTVGFDWDPARIAGLKIDATYYNIYFKNRIASASSQVSNILNALYLESVLGPTIVRRNPSLALVQQLASYPGYVNFLGIDLANIGAILDFRAQNLSAVRTDGLDLGISYKADLLTGTIETGMDATYILKFDDKFTPFSPSLEILNTPYNPVDFRTRARAEFQKGPVSVATFLNYTNSYKNSSFGPLVPVASWTTADINIAYRFSDGARAVSHATVMLGVTNVANKSPPFVANPNGLNFDGTNANALGRFWFLQMSKAW